MSEYQWDALAEIYLSNKDDGAQIYCLCSRVFVRSRDEKIKVNANLTDEFSVSETEALTEDDNKEVSARIEHHPEQCQSQESNDTKQEVDAEILSCYCSASHTDNISTDEHDSLRDSHPNANKHILRGLQSSDSGADLTEYVKTDNESAWHRYWTLNGERIIWDSWIAKYSDYINPEYIPAKDDAKQAHEKQLFPDGKIDLKEHSKSNKFSFDRRDLDRYSFDNCGEFVNNLDRIDENLELKDYKSQEISHVNHMLVRTLSGSDSYDKLHPEVSEGWNPLSPLSIDCETEAERLLSSRCGSHASSSARTVDSMTNVTRMTVSSFDLSDSSKTSDSFSSVSSVQSSFSSTSSEEADPADPSDYKQQWDSLWKQHYEEEYMHEYKRFMSSLSDCSDKEHKVKNIRLTHFAKFKLDSNKSNESRRTEDVNIVFNTLTIKMNDSEIVIEKSQKSADEEVVQMDADEQEAMRAMGLPINFGTIEKKITKKQYDSESDLDEPGQSSTDHVKSAFNLIGLEFNEAEKGKFKGHVEYKMKHIRLQNRHLKLHRQKKPCIIKPKHIRFDDDGNIILEERRADVDEDAVQFMSGDSDDQQTTTSSDTEQEQNKVPAFQQEEIEKSETVRLRKKKRKRKINLPPEIKENPNLRKYWSRRFSLFHKFDQGIRLDEESWYSVTPEQIGRHTAQRMKCDVVVDAFCGAGGNTIQFALTCNRVIAIDIDPNKIDLAKNNADVYGVGHKIEFIVGSFLDLSKMLKADAVFLSPPWGGPSYLRQSTYNLEEYLQPVPLTKMMEAARDISENVALFLPRNSDTYPLTAAAGKDGLVEIEQNFINKKLIAITAYYKDLIKNI